VKKYIEACSLSMKRERAFVLAFLAKMLRFPLALLVIGSVWRIIYSKASELGLTFNEMMAYYALVGFLRTCEGGFVYSIPYRVHEDVRSGDLGSYLSRPIWYPLYVMSIENGRLLLFACSGLPVLIAVLAVVHGIPDPGRLAWFLISALAGLTVSALTSLLIGLLSFWTGKVFGIRDLVMSVSLLTSGMVIPIRYLPRQLQQLADLLPFEQVYSAPIGVYLGTAPIATIRVQILWLVTLFFMVALVWSQGCKRFEAQGG